MFLDRKSLKAARFLVYAACSFRKSSVSGMAAEKKHYPVFRFPDPGKRALCPLFFVAGF
jgi:hypothetical protein